MKFMKQVGLITMVDIKKVFAFSKYCFKIKYFWF